MLSELASSANCKKQKTKNKKQMIKKSKIQLAASLAVALLSFAANTSQAADHEVYASGGRYYWKTFGVVRGNSTDLKTAIAGAVSTGNRTVYVLTGGTLSGTVGLQPGLTLDCTGKSFSKSGGYAFQANGIHNITVKNLTISGTYDMGIRFTGCNNITVDRINASGAGIGIRLDSALSEPWTKWVYNFKASNCNFNNCRSNGIETYSVDGYNISNIASRDMGACSVCINNSKRGVVGTVRGDRCMNGYAALRFVNSSDGATVSKVIARDCSRGFVSGTNSKNITVNNVDIANCSQGILIQTGSNVKILSGVSTGSTDTTHTNPNVIIQNSPGSYANVTN